MLITVPQKTENDVKAVYAKLRPLTVDDFAKYGKLADDSFIVLDSAKASFASWKKGNCHYTGM